MSLKKTLVALALGSLPKHSHPHLPPRRDVWMDQPLPNWKRSGVAAAKRAAKRRRKAKR
ncbi:hypothetical protein [Eikenella corrodens]|uniref:hypothetical protein n=1 Tax=Eikenella corrodens TaxID=539 RepID=UPI00129B115D|nr:hypothetical protein [Eikenella corrodens]